MPQHLEAFARALGVDPAALTDYGVETARDALEVFFRLEEGFGARPEADAAGARVVVDPAASGIQKLDAAVRAWAAMRARRDSGRSPMKSTSTGSAGLPAKWIEKEDAWGCPKVSNYQF